MPSSSHVVRPLGGVCAVVCLVLCLHGVLLGLHFEDTPRAVADAAKGRAVGVPAGAGLVLALVACIFATRLWSRVVLGVALALAVTALAVDLLR